MLVPDRLRVGYVLKRFPRFSETFILNELLTLQSLEVDVDVFSLLKPPDEPRHSKLQQLDFPVIGLAAYGKSASVKLHYGLDGGTQPFERLVGNESCELFSGKTKTEIAALHMKASAIAVRASSRNITHLHAHFGSDAATVALLAARMIRGTFSFTAHAKDIYHTYVSEGEDRAMRRSKMSEAAFVATVSEYNAAHLRQICPQASERIIKLYNGIDLSVFTPVVAERQSAGRIISVGRLVEKKGFSDLLEACAVLKDRGVKFQCFIVGDGPLRDTLYNQIHENNLQQHVEMAGALPQESLVELMESASIAVLPCIVTQSGDRDGLPTVLLEAMAKALPIITTSVSGGPEIVDHNKTGILCAPGDPKAFADAIEKLVLDPQVARTMGTQGRIRAQYRFDLHNNVAILKENFSKHCRQQSDAIEVA